MQSAPSVLLSPKGGKRPSANSHTVMETLIRLILLIALILAAATDAYGLHKYPTAGTRAVRNEVKDRSGKSVQSVPSVLLPPGG